MMPETPKCGDTAVTVSGDGAPVVLVHGMGLNRFMWDEQAPPLAAQFRVMRYDLLGHGESDVRPGRYAMADFIDQLARLLDSLDIERCALVGFSLGGLIVQAFTLAHAHRVAGLAVLNAGHDRSAEERTGMLARLEIARNAGFGATVEMALERWFTAGFSARRPDVIEKVRRWLQANNREAYAKIYRILAYGDQPLAHAIAAIQCPALVLACAEDPGNSPAMARRAAQRIPNARLAIVPGLKHMGLMEAPNAINEILLPFLDDVLNPVS
jgi:pimeloyl-ACP methyl ester carboxylesterase